MLMKRLVILTFSVFLGCSNPDSREKDITYSDQKILSNPFKIDKQGVHFSGTENIILVPENRRKKNSRLIGVHYYHLKAKTISNLSPVFYLPGGPGDKFDENSFFIKNSEQRKESRIYMMEKLNKKRDVFIINQRGNSRAPGFNMPNFTFSFEDPTGLTRKEDSINLSDSFAHAIKKFETLGVDVSGYDIMNHIADIDDIRKTANVDKILLYGNSFGSQSALCYINKYPHHVDRIMLSGVEPIDYAYDDPAHVWNVFERLDQDAQQDSLISSHLPGDGLVAAFKTIIDRLTSNPLEYPIKIPELGIDNTVLIEAEDLKNNIGLPFADSRKEYLETWPKYVTELHNGNYTMLALHLFQTQSSSKKTGLMIAPLMDNSLGISNSRDSILQNRKELRYIADPNIFYRFTAAASPTPIIPSSFRKQMKTDIPLLIIQGNMDWSTPIENAQYLTEHFPNSHLFTLIRGTHGSRDELISENKAVADQLYEFINIDFRKTSFSEFKESLPNDYKLEDFTYVPIFGKTILEQALSEN